MPCKSGTRKNIEAGIRYHEERKKTEASTAAVHWRWLVQQVHASASGFDGLSDENKLYYAVGLLQGDVFNGGFDQYFHNSSADYCLYATRGLELMEAMKSRALLDAVRKLLFGDGRVPATRTERFAMIGQLAEAPEAQLTELDQQFWKDPDALGDLMAKYATKHGIYNVP